MVVAHEPPRPLQPRFLRRIRQTLGRSRAQVWWNEAQKKWVGNDVPDFKPDSAPKDHMGPFIMNPEGVGRIFGPLAPSPTGRFPSSTSRSKARWSIRCIRQRSNNPVVKKFSTPLDKYGTPERGLQHRLHHLPSYRALSLLDQEQSDERPAGSRSRSSKYRWS